MNIEKTKQKLSQLSHADLTELYNLVMDEMDNRPTMMSNKTHTPSEQCKSLHQVFGQAWIHG